MHQPQPYSVCVSANGVILVTTKRGKEGKAKISANTSMSVIVPTDPIKLANAYEYASYYNMQKLNDGAATAPFSDQILQKFKDHSDPLRFPDTDWIDYCFKDHAIQTQHNVNISGEYRPHALLRICRCLHPGWSLQAAVSALRFQL